MMRKRLPRPKPTIFSTVYRVQDKNGRGPWKSGFSKVWAEDRRPEEYAELPPVHEQFPDLCFRPGYCVACETIEQLRKWIRRSEYETLKKYGYFAVEVDLCKILVRSDSQCVVARTKPMNKHFRKVRLY